MTIKQLIKQLDSKYLSGETMAEVKQKLLEYDELRKLALGIIDAQEELFLFMMSVLGEELDVSSFQKGDINYGREE